MKDADIIKWLNAIEKPTQLDTELEAPLPTFFTQPRRKSIDYDILELLFDLRVNFPHDLIQFIPEKTRSKLLTYLEKLEERTSGMRKLQMDLDDMLKKLDDINPEISNNPALQEKTKSSPEYATLISDIETKEKKLNKVKDSVAKSTQFIEDFVKSFYVSDQSKKSIAPHL